MGPEIKNSGVPENNFFIVRLRGGLGNQLFQYAAARIYSLKTGRAFKVDITGYANPENHRVVRGYKLENFNLTVPIANEDEVRKFKYPLGLISKIWRGIKTKIFKLDYLDYHPSLFEKRISYLDGYFQSERYFKEHSEIIRRECSVKPELISEQAKKIEYDMENSPSVAIHIRRGDLVTEIDAVKSQGSCSADYYEKASAHVCAQISISKDNQQNPLNPKLFIFSDDIHWVKNNMGFPEDSVYVSAFNLQDYEELYLMSKAQHNIIGNSTFSWWGAWLNQNPNKIVVAPKKWSTVETDHPHIIPESWVRI